MEITFVNSKKKLEKHLTFLIAQPIKEWQELNEVKIESIDICLLNNSVDTVKINLKT